MYYYWCQTDRQINIQTNKCTFQYIAGPDNSTCKVRKIQLRMVATMTFTRKKSQHLNYFAFDKVQLPNPWRISAHCLLMTFFRIFFAPLLHFCRTFVALFPPFEGMIFCATGAPSSNTHTRTFSMQNAIEGKSQKRENKCCGWSRRKGKVKILCERKEKVKIVGESEFVRNNVVD